jgi:hypothetical protein
MKKPGSAPGFFCLMKLFLLLAFGMRLVAMLIGGLRMLLRSIRMFLALGMIALTMVVGRGTMRLRRVFVVFGGLVVLVSCHDNPRLLFAPSGQQGGSGSIVPRLEK